MAQKWIYLLDCDLKVLPFLCLCPSLQIRCTRCRGKSEKFERMMDLTVEIEGDIETLEDALQKFSGTEPLDGENKYNCGRLGSLQYVGTLIYC